MPHPHNAENIREILSEVLQEWCIPSTIVGVVITDNGSNITFVLFIGIIPLSLGTRPSENQKEGLGDRLGSKCSGMYGICNY